ncbi:hypothetical protein [Streptomyces sp. NPDC002952]|uniref:hypothetical protein n=1 Tax=Streptomyces sp. NPDC002952 TaxID=3364673 RepID=UPI00367DFB4F
MTEYTAHSAHGSGSVARAYRIGTWVHVSSKERGRVASTALETAEARAFARTLLALADEIDGGEAKEEPKRAPKVGDRVRVTLDDEDIRTGEYVGKVGVLQVDHGAGSGNRYRVKFGDGSGLHGDRVNGTWNVRDVEVVDPEPATPDTRPKVGDRLRVTQKDAWSCPVNAGDIITVVDTRYDSTYGADIVKFDVDGDSFRWCIPLTAVEPLEDTPEPLAPWEREILASPGRSPRARFVEEAKALLADVDEDEAPALIKLAQFLADGDA